MVSSDKTRSKDKKKLALQLGFNQRFDASLGWGGGGVGGYALLGWGWGRGLRWGRVGVG